jgi:hypothetical protein
VEVRGRYNALYRCLWPTLPNASVFACTLRVIVYLSEKHMDYSFRRYMVHVSSTQNYRQRLAQLVRSTALPHQVALK